MKSFTAITILSAALSASALTINKARDTAATAPPSFTIDTTVSDGSTHQYQSANGIVNLAYNPQHWDYLTHAAIVDEANAGSTTCVARDQWGSQVRAFGGPQFGGVESVDFVAADGKQIWTLSCYST